MIDALPGIEAPNLTGGISKMLPNHHITKPVFIGEIRGDGQFDVVWKTPASSPATPGRRSSMAPRTWSATGSSKKCGNYNTKTNKCGGA